MYQRRHCLTIIVIVYTMTIIVFFTSCHMTHSVSSINYGKNDFFYNDSGHILMEDMYFFDTGSVLTFLIKSDSLCVEPTKETILSIGIKDVKGVTSVERVYYFENYPINNIQFNKTYLAMIPPENFSPNMRNLIQKGLIGMNFIKHANWLIDFKDSIIHCFSRDSLINIPKDNVMILKYKKHFHPRGSLIINNQEFKNILFDTGFNLDLFLKKEQIDKIKSKEVKIVESTTEGLYSLEVEKQNAYIFDELNINNMTFRNIEVVESNSISAVGVGFAKRFDNLFIDTKNRKIYLYN